MTILPITTNRFSPSASQTLKSKEYTPAHIQLMLRMQREKIPHVSNYQIMTDMISHEGFTKSIYPDLFLEPNICIQIDGKIHRKVGVAKKDAKKDAWLESHGYVVLRFKNWEIKQGMDAVIALIRATMRGNKE